jgi:hypothetical protein
MSIRFLINSSMELHQQHYLCSTTDKITTLQQALSLEMLVVHVFYGGMPRHKAEQSLRLFAEKVLPVVQAMPTPINPASVGALERCAG